MRGSYEGVKPLFSTADDVNLANPFGPVAKGWDRVLDEMERAALNYRDGKATGFDNISIVGTPDLAFLVEVERLRLKVGGRAEALRSGSRQCFEERGRQLEDCSSPC
jgi:hypothetical protein